MQRPLPDLAGIGRALNPRERNTGNPIANPAAQIRRQGISIRSSSASRPAPASTPAHPCSGRR